MLSAQPRIYIAGDITHSEFYEEFREQCASRIHFMGSPGKTDKHILTQLSFNSKKQVLNTTSNLGASAIIDSDWGHFHSLMQYSDNSFIVFCKDKALVFDVDKMDLLMDFNVK